MELIGTKIYDMLLLQYELTIHVTCLGRVKFWLLISEIQVKEGY